MRHALEDLRIDELWVIYPGAREYGLHDRVKVLPLERLLVIDFRAA